MRLIYSFAISIYALGVRMASPFNEKARQMRDGWRHWQKRLSQFVGQQSQRQSGRSRTVWFHASSLGEFEQARPVLEQFRRSRPDWKVVLTFFSPSGYEVRKNYDQADLVMYLPIDTRRNARQFVELLQPDMALFVKYDFWFNYLNELKKRGTPTLLFSSIFRPGQYFFRWYGAWFARQLQCYSHIFVQNEESVRLLAGVGYRHTTLAGDTRFDRVFDIAAQAKRFEGVERFVGDNPVLMAGSSWEPDESNIKQFADSYDKPLKIILAPHMIGAGHLNQIEHLMGPEQCLRYSQLVSAEASQLNRKVLIIDNIGMLSSLYRYATVAYIGGGFGKGIHNILEAAVFGTPVCFGPNYGKFQEANDMIACGGARSYNTAEELSQLLGRWLDDSNERKRAAQAAMKYMEEHRGSTAKIMERVEKL
ncbi:MAG: 3-deoxy-D-manno-octulosonic acid transferase [Bacteroidales bacterium]|nr:3-deoxy-D-manno-octulosonic acid transferase [Bacteroidales bacterium]